jgi:predicted RNase H-like HicB family nuclease/DNA-binding XRE family transcriptional regulator
VHYVAHIYREGKRWLAEFPDAPGCQTFANSKEELRAAAKEALEGWLEAHLASGQSPSRPQVRATAPSSKELWLVRVDPGLSVAVQIRWARLDLGLTQAQLAKRAKVTQQQIAKLEDPDENPTIKTLAKVSDALGVMVDVSFVSAA